MHYETLDDLLSECIEYIGNKIQKKFDNKVIDKGIIRTSQLKDLVLITPNYLFPYLEFLKDNKAVYKIAYSQPNVLKEKIVINHLYKNIFEPILNRFLVPKNEQQYMVSFFLAGIGAVIIDWIKNDCKEEISSIMNILTKCLNLGDIQKQFNMEKK